MLNLKNLSQSDIYFYLYKNVILNLSSFPYSFINSQGKKILLLLLNIIYINKCNMYSAFKNS